jgi:hypothetical protein
MAAVTLNIDQMTVEEKLAAMELLWQSLRQNEDAIPVPDWHKELLDEREREIEAGEVKFEDWETAKAWILKKTR